MKPSPHTQSQKSRLFNYIFIGRDRVTRILSQLWTVVRTMNLFSANSNQMSIQRHERIMTRIYIVSMLVVFIILLFYTSLHKNANSYTVYNVTQPIIEQLFVAYPDTIQCPCRYYSMHYDSFISISTSFHQICTSAFISNAFINQFWTFNQTFNLPYDFVQMTGSYFSSIASMCNIFTSFIWITSSQFRTSLFATANLLSPANLEIEASRLLNTFLSRISASSMLLYDHMVGAQALYQPLDTTMSAFNLQFTSDGSTEVKPQTFDGCSCLLKPKECSKSSALYTYHAENDSYTLAMVLDGINVSCVPFLSLLHSNLACWYSVACYQPVSSKNFF